MILLDYMTREALAIINIALAFLSLPPAFYLVRVLIKDRSSIDPKKHPLNRVLIFMFAGVATAAILNAFLAVVSLFGGGLISHNLSPYRSALLNVFFTFISWSLYFVHRSHK